MKTVNDFENVVIVDFEFGTQPGEVPHINCMVAQELDSGRWWKLNREQCLKLHAAPFPTDPRTLFVCFYATAELNCFKVLGWPLPARVIDLYVLQRALYNGRPLGWLKPDLADQKLGRGLNDCLLFHGLHEHVNPEKGDAAALSSRRAV
jgi:hypothetical protein